MPPVLKISTESGIVLFVEKRVWEDSVEIIIKAENISEPFLIHWGLRKEAEGQWHVPPERNWPSGTHPFDHAALQTLLKPGEGQITIKIDRDPGFNFMDFALFFPGEGSWDNNLGRNYRVVLPEPKKPEPAPPEAGGGGPPSAALPAIEAEITGKEMSQNSWTLMHRFNLCYDLLDRIGKNDINGLALIYVWLRFSALRQLTWQRNYNTKPSELGHALGRLFSKLSGRYKEAPEEREMIRLILTTLGRGSDAQRVRDEVLNIMHRRNIKEVSGHFMEEWHQKLHNNATPDDIVICQAYLEFLRSNGNPEVFYKTLEAGGVTKERIESYERPIRSHPDFIPNLKDALIHDFENFLSILKEVHSGTDLYSAIQAAERLLDNETKELLHIARSMSSDTSASAPALAGKIIEARRRLKDRFGAGNEETRDLLFMDMALEDFLRVLAERALEAIPGADELADFFSLALENVTLSPSDEEMDFCFGFWKKLEKTFPRFKKPWALRAEANRERIGRAIGAYAQRIHLLLQPVAERLGNAFHAEPWSVQTFSEEALRGRPVFALSALLRLIDPLLRKSAGMENWQIISRGKTEKEHGEKVGRALPAEKTSGQVKLTASLKEIQGQDFSENPVVLVAAEIGGDEEIPAGIPAIITPSTIDRLSHLAIRARNAGVLFATCLDPGILEQIKSMEGRFISLEAAVSGDMRFGEESKEEQAGMTAKRAKKGKTAVKIENKKSITRPAWSAWAVSLSEFTEQNVGYKSINLKRLAAQKLPEWINIPRSAALPFGVFEKTLSFKENGGTEKKYRELEGNSKETSGADLKKMLTELRNTVLDLKAPPDFIRALKDVMGKAGFQFPQDWPEAWACIKRVWASKWNDRAYLNRKANGIADADLFMSVLIQEVVNSDLSFVIHTANPFTGDKEEIYAEAVLGLGESLAGNYPGMPLSFAFKKGGRTARILSMPGKSKGFYIDKEGHKGGAGGGLIFRSDSNGEDLAGYAGAGLYDSFMLPEPEKVTLDYTGAPIVWDEKFLREFTSTVAKAGIEVEKAAGGPQDIEGASAGGKLYVVQARPEAGVD